MITFDCDGFSEKFRLESNREQFELTADEVTKVKGIVLITGDELER